ncbi:MAG: DUF3516 domain-containing protein [Myxococcota bacterium]
MANEDPNTAARLHNFLPSPLPCSDVDSILQAFLDAMAAKNLQLYPAQEEAILELMDDKNVVLNTPTGSGKSLVALALHFWAFALGKRSFYACPIKALTSEKFFALCREFTPQHVGMLTGDASINPAAPIICCTAEVLANMVLSNEQRQEIHCVVLDEFHYYADPERGMAWQLPLLCLPQATLLLMSATLGDPFELKRKLQKTSAREVAVVAHAQRPVPLDFTYCETPVHETLQELLAQNKAPIYVVHFTQRECVAAAQNLTSFNLCSREQKQAIAAELSHFRFDTPFGRDMKRFASHGIGLHHAGLLPKYRLLTEKLAQQGLIKVVVGTDTLGVGVNIPIRTVLLSQLCKFDGKRVAILRAREFHQIAGRAGRKGFDEAGRVACQAPAHVIENRRAQARFAAGQSKKKAPKPAPAPTRYAHWDTKTFERLIDKQPEPLRSQFTVSYFLLLTLLQNHRQNIGHGYTQLVQLIAQSHESSAAKRQHRRQAALLFRALQQSGIVQNKQTAGLAKKAAWCLQEQLQKEFSAHENLCLYLLSALQQLDTTHLDYGLQVLNLVEACLENPKVILQKQCDKLKQIKLAELKAQGVEYEERMQQLEKVEYPKPMADFIYSTFNVFCKQHPWMLQDNIHPKGIAHEMVQKCASFNEYVSEYGLQRSEGVLLRYLSSVYKILMQTVPNHNKTDPVWDVIAFFGDLLQRVDNSLITEWQQLQHPTISQTQQSIAIGTKPTNTLDEQGLRALIRTQMFQFLRYLSRKQYQEAALCVRSHQQNMWTAAQLEEALQDYYTQYDHIVADARARQAKFTLIHATSAKQWDVQQIIPDPQGDNQWVLEGFVPLRDIPQTGQPEAGRPLVCLQRIGC